MKNYQEKLESFVEKCQAKVNQSQVHPQPEFMYIQHILSIKHGRKYSKIIQGGGVFCFVDSTNGNVLKAASWKSPAKGMRGNIFDENNGMGRMGIFGQAYNN